MLNGKCDSPRTKWANRIEYKNNEVNPKIGVNRATKPKKKTEVISEIESDKRVIVVGARHKVDWELSSIFSPSKTVTQSKRVYYMCVSDISLASIDIRLLFEIVSPPF